MSTKAIAQGTIANRLQDQKYNAFEWVDLSKLNIDPAYQRTQTENAIGRMAENWCWVACGCLIIARRPDGSLVVMEGAHRVKAAKKRGIESLPCMIWDVPTVADEAQMFIWINTMRKSVKADELFASGVTANDPTCIVVEKMLASHGYRPGSSPGKKNIACIAAMKELAVVDLALCKKVFELCVQIADGDRITRHAFRGLSSLERTLRRRDDKFSIFDADNRNKLKAVGMESISVDCVKAAKFFGQGGDLSFARGILKMLNDGRKTNRIDPI